jgi:hypothetical protein
MFVSEQTPTERSGMIRFSADKVRGIVREGNHDDRKHSRPARSRGVEGTEPMRHFTCPLLPMIALALTLGGCGALERRPEPPSVSAVPTVSSGVPSGVSVATASPGVEALPEVRPAAGASAVYSPGVRPEDPRIKLNLHVFGFSYHTDRKGTRDSHLDNELNAGLGLNYEFHNDALGVANVEAGFFKDSGRNWAKFAGMGYQFKWGDRWRLGADLLAIHSQTYNNDRGFVAPIPRLTYDFGPVKLNAVYVPRYQDVNRFAVVGFYFTLPMSAW